MGFKFTKKTKKFSYFILIALLLIITAVIRYFILIYLASNEVKKVLLVDKPNTFVINFQPADYLPVTLNTRTVPGFGGRYTYYLSAYYPHNMIDVGSIPVVDCFEQKGDHRYLYLDKKWKVFWIFIVPCGGTSSGKLYGPFRTNLPIMNALDIHKYDPIPWLKESQSTPDRTVWNK